VAKDKSRKEKINLKERGLTEAGERLNRKINDETRGICWRSPGKQEGN